MQTENLATRARSYIAALELPPPPARSRELDAAAPDPTGPALAVGPNLVEFAPGADPALRPAMTDALLLAQLAADKADARRPGRLVRRPSRGAEPARLSRQRPDPHLAGFVHDRRRPARGDPAGDHRGLRRSRDSGDRDRHARTAVDGQREPALDPAFRAREPPVLGPAVPGDDGRRHRQRAERRDARLRHRLRPRDGTGAVLPARKGHRRRRADRRALRGGQPRAGRHRAGSRGAKLAERRHAYLAALEI